MELCQATLLDDWLTHIKFNLSIIACNVLCLVWVLSSCSCIRVLPLLGSLVLLSSGRIVLGIELRLRLLIRILVILLLLVWVVILLLLIWIIVLLLLLLVVWILRLVRILVVLLLLVLLLRVLLPAHHKKEQDKFAKIFHAIEDILVYS